MKCICVIGLKNRNSVENRKNYSAVRPDCKAALSDDKFETESDGKITDMLWTKVLEPNL